MDLEQPPQLLPERGEAAQVLLDPQCVAGLLAQDDFVVNQVEDAVRVRVQRRVLFQVILDADRLAAAPTAALIGAEEVR